MRSTTSLRRLIVVFTLFLLAYSLASAAPDDPAKAKAEAVYRDIYGADHDRAVNGTPAARVAFAKKLLSAAIQVNDDPALKSVILGKALKMAASTPTGTKTALEIHAALASDPRAKAAHAGELAELLVKALKEEPPAGKPKIAADLIAAFRDWATEQARRGDAGATKTLVRARDTARIYLAGDPARARDVLQAIDEQMKVVEKTLQHNKDLTRITDVLDSDPKNLEANVGMAMVEWRNNEAKKAAERLAALNVKELTALGRALGEAATTAQDRAEAALLATNAVTSPTNKASLLELARQNFEETLSRNRFNQIVARQFMGVLVSLLALEAPTAKPRTADRLAHLATDIAEDALQSGDADRATQALAEARAACKRYPGLQPALNELDAYERDFKPRLDLERERAKFAETLQKTPADPKANWGVASVLLRAGRPGDAAPYLLKCDKPEIRKLGELVQSKAADLDKAEAFRTAAGAAMGVDKVALQSGAREYYELFLQKKPDAQEAGRVRLLLGQLGDGPARRDRLPPGVVALYDSSKKEEVIKAIETGGQGPGKGSLDGSVRYLTPQSLRVTPVFCNVTVPGWKYPVVESPGYGQYRYIAFAWKKDGGTHHGFFLRAPEKWCGWGAGEPMDDRLNIVKTIPTQWTVVVRDMYKDFGNFQIVGLGLAPVDGVAGYYDAVFIGRTEADVRKAAARR
jgi:hypothetical protein